MATVRPEVVRVIMARWRDSGAGVSVVSGRSRVLRSAIGWAQAESIIDRNPLRDMRGPPRPGTRMHVPKQDVLALLRLSEVLVGKAEAAFDGSLGSRKSLHKAEQVRLLTRLAADSGARRGEMAALKFSDPDGRVLTIERGVSGNRSVRPRPSGSAGSPSVGPLSNCGGPAKEPGVVGQRELPLASGCSRGTSTTNGASLPTPWGTGSLSCARRPTWSGSVSTGCGILWPPSSSAGGNSCGHNTDSVIAIRPRRCGTTPTPFR